MHSISSRRLLISKPFSKRTYQGTSKEKTFRWYIINVQQDSSEDEKHDMADELENISAYIFAPSDIDEVHNENMTDLNVFCVKICDINSTDSI